MTLYYIYHSCFAIETDNLIIIIDYYKDSDTKDEQNGIVHQKLLKSDKKLYVLSTHIHYDHFNPSIFKWGSIKKEITYILSKDILESHECCSKDEAIFLDRGESYSDSEIKVEAFGSTDAGVSYAITIDNKVIFHAGDLNNWHWKDESTKEYSQEAESFYLEELQFIKEHHQEFDLVMFPVDQRLQTDYYLGAKQFVEKIKVHYFAPMHFDTHYTEANAFKKIAEQNGATFLEITKCGQQFDINL